MEKVSVEIKPDDEGFMGRECPTCEKYFKIKPGTGIPDYSDCYCPYCHHFGSQNEFWTKQQIEYAQSVVLNKVSSDLLKSMKRLERKPNKNQFLSIGISVKGRPTPITYYTEKELEERVKCSTCTLEYTIYGAFGYCPDCGIHNSKQIVTANFDLILKILDLAKIATPEIREKLIENALEDCISAFDGFSREHCFQLNNKLSFQNISNAKEKLLDHYDFNIAEGISDEDWNFVVMQFQKRHLLAHKMGIIDEEYVKKTCTNTDDVGKKVKITESDVINLIENLSIVVENITNNVQRI